MKFRLLLAVVLVLAGVAACSDNKRVGEGLDTGLKGQINDLNTTSTKGVSTTAAVIEDPGRATTTTKAPVTTAPATTAPKGTTTLAPDRTITVTINADQSGKTQFDPNAVSARIGTPITFTNNDTKMRYVLSPDAGFRSPDLQPGQSYVYRPTRVGQFQLKDGTRPYVTGSLTVSA